MKAPCLVLPSVFMKDFRTEFHQEIKANKIPCDLLEKWIQRSPVPAYQLQACVEAALVEQGEAMLKANGFARGKGKNADWSRG